MWQEAHYMGFVHPFDVGDLISMKHPLPATIDSTSSLSLRPSTSAAAAAALSAAAAATGATATQKSGLLELNKARCVKTRIDACTFEAGQDGTEVSSHLHACCLFSNSCCCYFVSYCCCQSGWRCSCFSCCCCPALYCFKCDPYLRGERRQEVSSGSWRRLLLLQIEVPVRLLKDKAICNDSRRPPHAKVQVELFMRKDHAKPDILKVSNPIIPNPGTLNPQRDIGILIGPG